MDAFLKALVSATLRIPEFFDKKPEDIKINPKNPELLRIHLACCIHEMTKITINNMRLKS
jgi:ATP-dependent helicase YprA (DUF1998 family)